MQTYIYYIMHIRYIYILYIQQTHKKVQPFHTSNLHKETHAKTSHSAALTPDAAHMEVNKLDFWWP